MHLQLTIKVFKNGLFSLRYIYHLNFLPTLSTNPFQSGLDSRFFENAQSLFSRCALLNDVLIRFIETKTFLFQSCRTSRPVRFLDNIKCLTIALSHTKPAPSRKSMNKVWRLTEPSNRP